MKKRNVLKEVAGVFGYAMSVLFVVLGFYLIFASNLDTFTTMPRELRNILGAIFICYGFFRSVINYQKQHQRSDDEDED